MALRYAKPAGLEEALRLLKEDRWKILAGGTDFYPSLGDWPLRENVLDINGLAELRGIAETQTHLVIGARTTWTDVIYHPLPAAFDGLKLAAREVGSIQIQNRGTVAGNLGNASPAADGVPPLLTLDAQIELRMLGNMRRLPVSSFLLGNRETALAPGEMITGIRIPKAAVQGGSGFVKLGARRYLVISIAMAAARVVLAHGKIEDVALSVGACSAVAQRLRQLEEGLRGMEADRAASIISDYDFPELAPIDDVRGTAGYRRSAAREIVIRAFLQALERERGGLAA
ncbi:xanthine dehydrogenase family protein subunit M [Chelativorans sp. Marseille-P2723]|uniref:FAD binding domain-containing protein n=1 Tax=Chelativorans sp. Marseille-P2723 TaxID=2709133 RepID=UPI00156DC2C9|nr:xanthine dehydrogenase family protein subunit M [Chelativorans sp. Marseille-P2723]